MPVSLAVPKRRGGVSTASRLSIKQRLYAQSSISPSENAGVAPARPTKERSVVDARQSTPSKKVVQTISKASIPATTIKKEGHNRQQVEVQSTDLTADAAAKRKREELTKPSDDVSADQAGLTKPKSAGKKINWSNRIVVSSPDDEPTPAEMYRNKCGGSSPPPKRARNSATTPSTSNVEAPKIGSLTFKPKATPTMSSTLPQAKATPLPSVGTG